MSMENIAPAGHHVVKQRAKLQDRLNEWDTVITPDAQVQAREAIHRQLASNAERISVGSFGGVFKNNSDSAPPKTEKVRQLAAEYGISLSAETAEELPPQ